MFSKRIITYLIETKIPRSIVRNHVCGIKTISTRFEILDQKSSVSKNCQTILTNAVFPSSLVSAKRYKSGKKKHKQGQNDQDDDDEYTEQELEDITGDKNAKVITMQVSAMRVDAIVKATMNMARNKAEVALYESKIRINGGKVLKKSVPIKIGDVIDLVRGPSPQNPDFLLVTRVTIIAASTSNDSYRVKFVRDKALVIENYEDSWEPISAS